MPAKRVVYDNEAVPRMIADVLEGRKRNSKYQPCRRIVAVPLGSRSMFSRLRYVRATSNN